MNPNESRTLWISIGAALLSMFLLYSWSQEQKTQMARKFGATKRVVVAKEDIGEMETIVESKLDYVERPNDFIQPEAVLDPEQAIGQVAAVPIKKDEQIVGTKLLLPGPDTGLSLEVSPGKRAITIPVDDIRGVAKLLRPGDRIDIVAAIDVGRGMDSKREVRTVLQDIPVLATGMHVVNKLPRAFEDDGNGNLNRLNLNVIRNSTNITIEAKPEEVQQLVYILATSPGSLFTTLRHPNDRLQQPLRITQVDDIMQRPQVARVPASPEAAPPPAPVAQPRPAAPPPKRNKNGFDKL